ncbi:MAG TPA: c-type cytochrome [Acidobacteriaceae bacterium]
MTSRSLSLLGCGSLLAASMVFAQQPSPAPAQRRPIPNPINLKVLPKDMTGPQVIAIMRGFEGDLGVECSFCHAKDSTTGRLNFASDANPMKDTARIMMKMTSTINQEYLTQLTDPKPETTVGCGTCHRGMSKPPAFVPPPEKHESAHPASAPPNAPPSS